jgi:hypothetical protein
VSYLKGTFAFAAVLWGGLFAFAYAAAPKSCQWGQNAYFFAGICALLVLMAAPLLAPLGLAFWKRALLSLCFGGLTAGIWLGGLFAANFKLLCRLF